MAKDSPREYKRKESSFTSGLFWGAALGTAGMFLFGTKRGRKVKDYLRQHGHKVLEELEEIYEETEGERKPAKELPQPQKKTADKKGTKKQDVSHIKKLQLRGREAAGRFFTRGGKSLKK